MSASKNKSLPFDKIKVIGFDLDQTLYPKSSAIDSAIQKYLYEKISVHLKIKISEAKKKFLDLYKNGSGISGSKIMEYFKIPEAKDSIQKALEDANIERFLKPKKNTIKLIAYLKNKYINLDIITGSNKKITFKKLKKLNISPKLFNNIITSDDSTKSDLRAYILWMKKYADLKPNNFLYVGDRVNSDFIAPNSLGIRTILVNQKKINKKIDCLQLRKITDLKKVM